MKKLIKSIKQWFNPKEEDWIDDIIRNGLHYPNTDKDRQIISALKRMKNN